ncbi:putative oxidoreductase, partial [Tremellales sp. Uapishka_1]
MTTSLSGATVLITGGSSGLGRALAERYVACGAKVYVTSRTSASSSAPQDSITTIQSDISSASDRESLARYVRQNLPLLNILVNNAGFARTVPLAKDTDTPWSERQLEIDTDLAGPVHLTSMLVPLMLAHKQPGMVINVTSGVAFFPMPSAPMYSAVKHAFRAYTMTLRHALADTTLDVIEIIPPLIKTGLAGSDDGLPLDEFVEAI